MLPGVGSLRVSKCFGLVRSIAGFNSTNTCGCISRTRWRSIYQTSYINPDESQDYREFLQRLETFKGGDIHLDMNRETGVAVVRLDNVATKNALTGSMMIRLAEVVSDLESWHQGKAVILLGSGDSFCSGGDLQVLVKNLSTPGLGGMMCRFMQETMHRFAKLPLVSVAAIQGKALGGGAELATACDFRLMQDNAEIRFVQSKMGITTGWGGGSRLVNIVGRRKALHLLLTAYKVNIEDAIDMGLVDGRLSNYVDPVQYTESWLKDRNFLSSSPTLVHSIKKMVDFSATHNIDDAYLHEKEIFEQFWQGDMHNNALSQSMKHR